MENYSVFQIDSKKDLNFISMLLKSKFVRKFKIINPKKI